ncbi:flagellar hook-length control protein FliK [Acidovorax sp.]|uniref:flagellar hook-length control protein FliK n=1 Tax=Acidovorax sp. TaxID=1872122 RepID=UPI00262BB014|nr:flagellar hook-length control protein FliK [Acidovorax sp.]
MEQAKISSSSPSSQGTQATHASRAKASAQQGVDAAGDAAAQGGFLALLAALDGLPEGGGMAEALSSDLPPADMAADAAVDAAAVAAWQGLFARVPGDVTTEVARQGGGMLQPGTAANGVLGGGGQTGGVFGPSSALNEMVWGGMPQGLVAETAKLDASQDLQGGPVQGAVAGFGRNFSRMQSAQALRADGALGGGAALGQSVAAESTQRLSTAHGAAAALAQAASERPAVGLQAAGAVAERGAGAPGGPLGAELSPLLAENALAEVASVRGGEPSGGGRAGEGQAGGSAWADGGGGAPALEAGNIDDATLFADPGSAGAEEQVADQVAYWVNQKTQNAELTLNRDGQPVEVSVSLSGNEAHVSFRSDQAQTRELLDQSMAQLRDLLRSEGLVLSGMSVGTSAQDGGDKRGGDEGQSRNREGARQARVLSSAPAGTASLARSGGGAERAVDIFV